MSQKATEFKNSILAGHFDNELKDLSQAIRFREQQVGEDMLYTLKKGDKVRIDNIRPKYLCGEVAEVHATNRTTVTVRFGEHLGRRAGGLSRVPVSCIVEKVED